MENSNYNYPRNRHNDHLSVNRIGKSIRKSPIHQSDFGNPKQQQQPPQPQVYNISKNDFRNIVQQLTGSPSHNDTPSPPPPAVPRHNQPKHPSMRLQKIRPPPLTPFTHTTIPTLPPPHASVLFNNYSNPNPNSPFFGRPNPLSPLPPITLADSVRTNTAESPISAYMRHLQNSIIDPKQTQMPTQVQAHGPAFSSGLLPTPPFAPVFPSPRGNTSSLLPSPSSQFLLPSPSSFLNLFSPRSTYPLLSPGFQYPPLSPGFQYPSPFTPNFSLSPLPQQASGILGPGPQQPPLSPSILFPPSPSGFLPLTSPRWRD